MGRRRLDRGHFDKIYLGQTWTELDQVLLEAADVRPGKDAAQSKDDEEPKAEEEERMWQRHLALVRVR